jgi:aldehyde dehydrogenase (NAD+)
LEVNVADSGKSPNIFFGDVDVKEAVDWATNGALLVMIGVFYNHGQNCCAGSRIYVHKDIYDEFMTQFVACAKKIKVGNQMDVDTEMGTITL